MPGGLVPPPPQEVKSSEVFSLSSHISKKSNFGVPICAWKTTDWLTPSYSFHVLRSDGNRIENSSGGYRQKNSQCLNEGSGESGRPGGGVGAEPMHA